MFRNWADPVPFVIHALPALANVILYGIVYLAGGRDHFASVVVEVFAGRAPLYVILIEWGKIIMGLTYTGLIIRLIYRNQDGVKRWAAREQRKRWLKALISAFTLCWLIVLVSAILMWSRKFPENLGIIITGIQLVAFLAFLYMVTFFALRYPAILEPRDIREEIRRKLNLPEGFVEETLKRLEKARLARFYTDPEITLPMLAKNLGLHANALSYIVNEETDSGFREYLNNLRLEDFLLQAASDDGNKTQLDMAFEAGFSSKTTFLRAFRGRYNTTPAEYLANSGTGSHTSGTTTHTGTPG
jgi:AraC-like DNA-binding protein